jgi:hypothetical protein
VDDKTQMERSIEAEAVLANRRNPDNLSMKDRLDGRGRVRVWEFASKRFRDLYPIDVREGMKQTPPAFAFDKPGKAAPAPAPAPEPTPEPDGIDFAAYKIAELKPMHADAVHRGLDIAMPESDWRKEDWADALRLVNYTPTS